MADKKYIEIIALKKKIFKDLILPLIFLIMLTGFNIYYGIFTNFKYPIPMVFNAMLCIFCIRFYIEDYCSSEPDIEWIGKNYG